MEFGHYFRAFVLALLLVFEGLSLRRVEAMPAQIKLGLLKGTDNLQHVEDTCWWWGTRWQYGWRGYGWYPCWDWTKPFPDAVAREAVPESAIMRPCIKRWRDDSGKWHQGVC